MHFITGDGTEEEVRKIELLHETGTCISGTTAKLLPASLAKEQETGAPAAALELA